MPVNFDGVSRIQLYQIQTSPPVVRMTLQVNKNSPDWQATLSPDGGVVVIPTSGIVAATTENQRPSLFSQPSSVPTDHQPPPGVATIQSVQLAMDGTQLLIRASQPLTYHSGWDRSNSLYRITIDNAQLAREVKEPIPNANSPLMQLRLQQTDPNTVVISAQPAAGVEIGELNQPTSQMLSLQLQHGSTALTPSPSPSLPLRLPSTQTFAPPKPRARNERIVVVIDPGHGGKDSGAIGIGGLQEKNVILPIGQQVAAILEKHGVRAVLTRTGDYFVDLAPRVVMTQRLNADLFVSIHANSIDHRPDANGLEVYYYDRGLGLAQTIQKSILNSIDEHNRGVRRARFYVLRNNSIPAVLVETGFVTGAEDAPRLASPAYQHQMAAAIARGILQYIQQNF
jgi:N-acetylmuramoyl-L-alanine amidase